MRHARVLSAAVVMFMPAALVAQGKSAAPAASPTPPPPPTIKGEIDREVSTLEREFVGAAEAMPEDKYDFAPTGLNISGSEFKGVSTFAEQVKHVAMTNFQLWGPITGDKSPFDAKGDNG